MGFNFCYDAATAHPFRFLRRRCVLGPARMYRRAFCFILLGTKGFVTFAYWLPALGTKVFAFCAQADEHVLSRRVCHRPQTMQRFASSPYRRSALRAPRTSFICFI